jgi:response regulator of citrate/malate metabolism
MTKTPTLAIPDGRRALAQMYLDLTLAFDLSTYPPGQPARETNANQTLVAVAVMLGHAEGRPMTAQELASRLNMPRTSVLRRLNGLMARGLITRIQDRYYLSIKRAPHVPHLDRFELILNQGFAALAPILSKTDE